MKLNYKDTLNKANGNLYKRFGDKHINITQDDIERVYFRQLFSIEADAKTRKGSIEGYLTGVLYLAPYNISGINTCPGASKGCSEACLFEAGRGVMYPVFRARVIKTLAFYLDPERFEAALNESIRLLKVKAKNKNMMPVVRLNGTSDILWDKRTKVIQNHPDIQFYEYSKLSARFKMSRPENLDLTFSLHETNLEAAKDVLANGGRVAVVFRNELPETYWGYPVVDGDKTDLRFLDPKGCIVGLKAKGPARKDASGFVQDVESQNEKVAA